MNISVIIPVHEYDDKIKNFLNDAINSVRKQEKIDELPKIFLVCAKSIQDKLEEYLKSPSEEEINPSIELVINNGDADFQSQVNLGVSKVETEYFSILELDDEYSKTYFYNMEKYIKYHDDVDIFLSMMIETTEKNENLKLTNEVVWAQQFVGENGEMGFLNQNALKQYTDFKISGASIRKDEYLNIGGLKKNIKLTFNYEFLLRALNNACRIFTVDKIGYKHLNGREGSLFSEYQKNMPINERNFWFETATRESNFNTDRPIDTTKMNKIVVDEK